MSSPFQAAWMLLKQRGHELNLPKPVRRDIGPYESDMSPQDLIDARVNAASKQRHALNEIEMAGTQNPRINSMDDAMAFLDNQKFNQREMEDQLFDAQNYEGEEAYYQGEQGALDRATLARRAQQPEADEMEAMGVPPMSRTMGGTPPPNIGRAGSTNAFEPSSQEYLSDIEQQLQEMGLSPEEINYEINNMTPRNPFPKPLAGRVQDQLAEFADGAGRRAAMSPTPDYSKHENSTDLYHDSFNENDDFNPINSVPTDAHPEAHNIASTTLRDTPRKTKRGQIDEPRVTPRMQGRAARSTSPFIGGQ